MKFSYPVGCIAEIGTAAGVNITKGNTSGRITDAQGMI